MCSEVKSSVFKLILGTGHHGHGLTGVRERSEDLGMDVFIISNIVLDLEDGSSDDLACESDRVEGVVSLTSMSFNNGLAANKEFLVFIIDFLQLRVSSSDLHFICVFITSLLIVSLLSEAEPIDKNASNHKRDNNSNTHDSLGSLASFVIVTFLLCVVINSFPNIIPKPILVNSKGILVAVPFSSAIRVSGIEVLTGI